MDIGELRALARGRDLLAVQRRRGADVRQVRHDEIRDADLRQPCDVGDQIADRHGDRAVRAGEEGLQRPAGRAERLEGRDRVQIIVRAAPDDEQVIFGRGRMVLQIIVKFAVHPGIGQADRRIARQPTDIAGAGFRPADRVILQRRPDIEQRIQIFRIDRAIAELVLEIGRGWVIQADQLGNVAGIRQAVAEDGDAGIQALGLCVAADEGCGKADSQDGGADGFEIHRFPQSRCERLVCRHTGFGSV